MKKKMNRVTPAEVQEKWESLHLLLLEYKEEKRLTNQEIGDAINVSADRVRKYFAGELKNPSVYGVMALCVFFGLSLDALLGNPHSKAVAEVEAEIANYKETATRLETDIAELKHENQILKLKLEHEQEKAQKAEKAQKRTAALLAVMVFALVIYFGIDIANRDVGFVRDTYILPMAFLVGAVIVGGVVALIGMIVGLFKEYRKKENHRD